MHFFTSITTNYLPKARVLAKSVKKYHPNAVFHLLLSDNPPEEFHLAGEPFDSLILIQDLDIPDIASWTFKHSVVELCTAVKASAFLKLFEITDADKIIYFDPDIVVLHDLESLSDHLDRHSVLFTPHQVTPDITDEAIIDNEICSLKHGVYNLGFLAVRSSEDGLKFLRWWRDRLLKFCYDDIPNGLFTDQKWADLAPAFFDDIFILRDKTCNVATWNLSRRRITTDDSGNLMAEGLPVKFFHFSGFDSGAQEVMLKKYAGNVPALFELREWYIRELDREGQEAFGNLPCAYSFYSNGEQIKHSDRLLYRSRQDLIQSFPRPAEVTEDKLCYFCWLREEARKEVHEQDDRLSATERELNIMLNSRSWRITHPLRQLADKMRKVRSAMKGFCQ
jgi:hypothetical protein